MGEQTIAVDGSGQGSFSITTAPLVAGEVVTATVTNGVPPTTSELSTYFTVTAS